MYSPCTFVFFEDPSVGIPVGRRLVGMEVRAESSDAVGIIPSSANASQYSLARDVKKVSLLIFFVYPYLCITQSE